MEAQLENERKRSSILEQKLTKTKDKLEASKEEVKGLQRKHDTNWSPKRELERSASYGNSPWSLLCILTRI